MKFQGTGFYVKSHDEMCRVFKDTPDVLTRTLAIAERCSMRLEKVSSPFPHFDVPPGYTLDSYLEHVTREGFARRLEGLARDHRAELVVSETVLAHAGLALAGTPSQELEIRGRIERLTVRILASARDLPEFPPPLARTGRRSPQAKVSLSGRA
jgi:DNA polymerase III alpha subunit